MSEMQLSHNDAENTRPVGRFLLGIEDSEGKYDTYTYASRFASNYRDILNPNWRASRVAVEEINGQRVELEFVIDRTDDEYAWRVSVGGELYEVRTSGYETYGTYYEFTSQRALLRRRHIVSAADLNVLQGIVEHMTDTTDFHREASVLRGDKTRTHTSIDELARKNAHTHGEDKNLRALRSHLFLAGFPVGSRDISGQVPLLGD